MPETRKLMERHSPGNRRDCPAFSGQSRPLSQTERRVTQRVRQRAAPEATGDAGPARPALQDQARKKEPVGDVIITPIDTISAHKCTTVLWTAIRGAHKISKKTNQSTKGSTSGLIHRRSYADVAAAPA